MQKRRTIFSGLWFVLYTAVSNSWFILRNTPLLIVPAVLIILLINIFAGAPYCGIPSRRLKVERHGCVCLTVFLLTVVVSAAFHVWLGIEMWADEKTGFIISALWCGLSLVLIFWNGIISVYLVSVQLGIRIRIIGILCGWIPAVNIIVLCRIITVCRREVEFETEKCLIDEARRGNKVCMTKYPLLLVHGVFFRDSKRLNYWGRIPAELEKNGAVVYYGEHQSAASVVDSAGEISRRIEEIVRSTGCDKVNIIAHSKGGLDCRLAIAHEAGKYVASLTTINTPHRGCGFADYLLKKIPEKVQNKVAAGYNFAAKKLGDKSPDFLAAVRDLTAERCMELDQQLKVPEGVYCQSVGSELKKATGGKFPLNFSYNLVKYFDGPNDGLVSAGAFKWGEKYTYVTPVKKRGISHGDMIDLNRENIPGFDVREFYVELVADLKSRGL